MLPVLSAVRLHEVLVRVEQDAPVTVNTNHPDGQNWSLISGAEIDSCHLLLVGVPVQEAELISTDDSNYSVPELENFWKNVKF